MAGVLHEIMRAGDLKQAEHTAHTAHSSGHTVSLQASYHRAQDVHESFENRVFLHRNVFNVRIVIRDLERRNLERTRKTEKAEIFKKESLFILPSFRGSGSVWKQRRLCSFRPPSVSVPYSCATNWRLSPQECPSQSLSRTPDCLCWGWNCAGFQTRWWPVSWYHSAGIPVVA